MIKKINLFNLMCMLMFSYAKGAIVHVQPNPAITYSTSGMQNPGIDLNNDGTVDVKFRLDYYTPGSPFYYYHLGGLTNGSEGIMDAAIGVNQYGVPYWKILTAGTPIGAASANFQANTGGPEPLLGDKDNDNIINKGDCLIGLKFVAAGNTHYAWMRVNLTGSTSNLVPNKVIDWAYESTPNTTINAGDMGSGSTTIAVTGITVDGQGGVSTITANNGTLQMTAAVMPGNASNKAIAWSLQNGTGSATISATGLLTAKTNGTVIVKATAQDGSNVSGTKTITISGQTVGLANINTLASNCYPNPVKEKMILEFGKDETIYNIRIFNLAGQVIYSDAGIKKGRSIIISTALLTEGPYILTFENTEGEQGLQKFVKQQ